MGFMLDIAGERFGRLLVLKRVMVRGAKNVMWKCQCDCGGSIVAAASNIKSGTTRSCGCLARETAAALLLGNRNQRTHLKSKTPEYNSWTGMKQRCTNPNAPKYPMYGGRGIKVCDRWLNSFEDFLSDVGPRPIGHTLHRVDNDGNYEPSNCVWANSKTQGRNTTRSLLIEIEGTTLCLSEWCEKLGIPLWKVTEAVRCRDGRNAKFRTKSDALTALYHQARS